MDASKTPRRDAVQKSGDADEHDEDQDDVATVGCRCGHRISEALNHLRFGTMRVLVTGGAGFIGSHFVKRLAAAGDEVVVLDKLTYSGNRANLRGRRARVPRGRHRRAGRRRRGAARGLRRRSSTSPPRRTSTARSSAPRTSAAPSSAARRCCSSTCARPAARFVQVSTDEVYGDLEAGGSAARATRSGRRARTARPRPPATCSSRPTCAPSASTPRSRAARTPTGRTSTRRSSSRSSSRTRSTASRCRSTATAARCATGSTSRTTAPGSSSCCARARPARSTTSAAATSARTSSGRADRSSSPAPTRRCSAASPTGPATTAATRSTRRSCARSAGGPATRFADGLRGDGRVVPRRTAPGGSRSSPASTARTTSGSTRERLA